MRRDANGKTTCVGNLTAATTVEVRKKINHILSQTHFSLSLFPSLEASRDNLDSLRSGFHSEKKREGEERFQIS